MSRKEGTAVWLFVVIYIAIRALTLS